MELSSEVIDPGSPVVQTRGAGASLASLEYDNWAHCGAVEGAKVNEIFSDHLLSCFLVDQYFNPCFRNIEVVRYSLEACASGTAPATLS